MTVGEDAERWQQIKLMLGEALECDAEGRMALLGELRSSDPDLAQEVQSLLGWYEGSADLSSPLGETATHRPLEAGARLGPYEVLALLGAGGMGAVYRARDTRLERVVAVKVLAAASDDGSSLLRFEREARTVASLSHPNIVSIFDYGREGPTAFAVTELLDGESLRRRLRAGPLPTAEALGLARQIASGLAAAHREGIVHRDLKPENVFLCSDGTARILDFGLAKRTWPLAPTQGGAALTRAGVLMGTVGYMPPEQVRGQEVDARADVFAFGITLHEMLTGRRPFDRGTPAETLAAVLRDERPPSDPTSVPRPLVRLLDRCLAKDPSSRFPSGRELLQALESTPAPRSDRWRLERKAALAGIIAAALAGVASVARQGGPPLRRPDLTIPVGRNPSALAFDGESVWVANQASNSVTRIRARDGQVRGTFPAGEGPVAVAWDGTHIWVANHKWLTGDYSTLMKLDPTTGRVSATYRLPGQPMHLTADADYLWVIETWPTYVLRKLRLSDAGELGAFTAGGTPRQAAADGESLWVSNGPVGFLSKIRASDGKVLLSRDLGGQPNHLHRVGADLWVSNHAGTLLRLRAQDLEVLARLESWDLAQAGSVQWLFTSEPGRLLQRRAADGRIVAAWAVGPEPRALMFDGANLWAADWTANSVTLVSGRSLAAADPSSGSAPAQK